MILRSFLEREESVDTSANNWRVGKPLHGVVDFPLRTDINHMEIANTEIQMVRLVCKVVQTLEKHHIISDETCDQLSTCILSVWLYQYKEWVGSTCTLIIWEIARITTSSLLCISLKGSLAKPVIEVFTAARSPARKYTTLAIIWLERYSTFCSWLRTRSTSYASSLI